METADPARSNFPDMVRKAQVRAGQLALWYIGGAGYIVRTNQATLLIDPFLGPSNPPSWIREIPPAFDAERIDELGRIDAVLLTHEHGDHTDPVALRALAARTSAPVFGPASCIAVAEASGYPADRRQVVDHNETLTAGDVKITAEAMHDPGAKGCNGYVLETGGLALLHCGDSLYFDGFVKLGQRWALDAICVSVGHNPPGRTFYMDESGAARAARDAGASILIPQHYDLWKGITLDPKRIRTAAGWYCPDTRVMPARFCRRLTISRDQSGLAAR